MQSNVFRALALAGLAVSVNGCAAAGAGKSNEVHYTLPPAQIAPGEETMRCWYTTLQTDADVYATTFVTDQAPGGHHIVAFTTTEDVADGTVIDCSGPESMVNWSPILTGLDKGGFAFPDGYAVRVPAHARLVFQSHYINATTAPITTHDEVTIDYRRDAVGVTLVGTSANTTLDFSIEPGATKTVSFDCEVTQPMEVFTLIGHMHEWGRALTIEAGPPTAMASLYDIPQWEPVFRDSPPTIDYGFDAPLHLAVGDIVRTSCTWQNTESAALGFPKEMCVSLFWFYPAEHSLTCTRSTASN